MDCLPTVGENSVARMVEVASQKAISGRSRSVSEGALSRGFIVFFWRAISRVAPILVSELDLLGAAGAKGLELVCERDNGHNGVDGRP